MAARREPRGTGAGTGSAAGGSARAGPVTDEVEARPPAIPVAALVLTTAASVAFVAQAVAEGAGRTDQVSTAAVLGWAFGSVVGLLLFAWFGSLDAVRRATGRYVEPAWNPRAVAAVLAASGWVVGAVGALLVAEAVARR